MSRPWMPLYVGDYLADTAHLRTAEHGAYLLLIMHYWRTEGLPQEDASLARICRMTLAEWKKARPAIEPLFSDGWKHKRIEFELTEAARISAAGKCGGEASGKARKNKSATKSKTETNDRSTTVQRLANDQPTIGEALHSPSPSEAKASAKNASRETSPDAETDLFRRGKEVLGNQAGGLIANLLKAREGKIPLARAAIETAATKENPREYLGAIIRGRDPPERTVDPRL